MATDPKIKKAFISKAIKRPGALTRKANAAGMSVNEYARQHQNDGGLTGKQAHFYLNVLHRVNARGR